MENLQNELTIDERLDWLMNNEPIDYVPSFGSSWRFFVNEIKCDLYMYAFNHPYYIGQKIYTDNEMRHLILDEFNVPRKF